MLVLGIILIIIGVILAGFAGMMIQDIYGDDTGTTVLIIASFIACFIGGAIIHQEAYKEGTIDAESGNPAYKLEKQKDGTVEWKYIHDEKDKKQKNEIEILKKRMLLLEDKNNQRREKNDSKQ